MVSIQHAACSSRCSGGRARGALLARLSVWRAGCTGCRAHTTDSPRPRPCICSYINQLHTVVIKPAARRARYAAEPARRNPARKPPARCCGARSPLARSVVRHCAARTPDRRLVDRPADGVVVAAGLHVGHPVLFVHGTFHGAWCWAEVRAPASGSLTPISDPSGTCIPSLN